MGKITSFAQALLLLLLPLVESVTAMADCSSQQPSVCAVLPPENSKIDATEALEKLSETFVSATGNVTTYTGFDASFTIELDKSVVSDVSPVAYVDGCSDSAQTNCQLKEDNVQLKSTRECVFQNLNQTDDGKEIVFFALSFSLLTQLCYEPPSYLHVRQSPEPPTNITLSETALPLRVRWEGGVSEYTVQFRLTMQPTNHIGHTNDSYYDLPAEALEKLNPGTISIEVASELANSDEAVKSELAYFDLDVPEAPTIDLAKQETSGRHTHYQLSWSFGKAPLPPLSNILIQVWTNGSDSASLMETRPPGSQTYNLILADDTNHTISVFGRNALGDGSFASRNVFNAFEPDATVLTSASDLFPSPSFSFSPSFSLLSLSSPLPTVLMPDGDNSGLSTGKLLVIIITPVISLGCTITVIGFMYCAFR